MSVKLLTEHNLDFLSLKGGCTGSSESTLIKMPCCWKSHVATHVHKDTSINSSLNRFLPNFMHALFFINNLDGLIWNLSNALFPRLPPRGPRLWHIFPWWDAFKQVELL